MIPCSNGNIDYFEFISPNVANFFHVRSNNDCSFVLEPYTWIKKGNILTLTFSGIPYNAIISELTASRLVFTSCTKSPDFVPITKYHSNFINSDF